MIDIDSLRADTPGCDRYIHLNNAGAGLMPRPVLNAIKTYLDLESEIGGYEAADLKAKEINEFYSEGAALFNCKPDNVAFTTNATDAYSRALSSVLFKKGDSILTSVNDYISNQIAFISLANRFGIRISRVPNLENGMIDLDAAFGLIREQKPKLVAISHVPTNSGVIQPVREIGKICRESEVLYLVDACQSMGQLNVDFSDIGCDFMSGTMRKFMRGPRGAGILLVSDRALDKGCEPLFIDMRGASWTSDNNYESLDSAKRFEDWEFGYGLMMGSIEAIKYIRKIGIDRIEKQARFLADHTRDRIRKLDNIRIIDDGDNLCGILTLHNPNWDMKDLQKLLRDHHINHSISLREYGVIHYKAKNVEWALRISPHYYNTVEEIDKFINVLEHLQ